MIIGLTGLLSAGKDTVADHLVSKGFYHISLSQILREIVKSEGSGSSIKELTEYGNKLRRTKGEGYLAKLALERVKEKKNAVISSIRQTGEIQELKKDPNFYFFAVEAPQKIRFERLAERNRFDDPKNFEEFAKIENDQLDGKKGDMNLLSCFKMTDYKIDNSGTKKELYIKLDELLRRINAEKK